MEMFDLVDRKWIQCNNMLDNFRLPIVCAVGKIIYVMPNTDKKANKGLNTQNEITLQCYDTTSDLWSFGPAPPAVVTDTTGASATSIDDLLYLVGGKQKLCLCYDTLHKSWTSLGNSSQPQFYGSAVSLGNKILLCGGSYCDKRLDIMQRFDAKQGEWKVLPYKLPVPMYCLFCCVIE